MYLFSDYYSLSLFMGGVIALVSGLIAFLNNSKKDSNIAWFLLTLTTAIWSFGYLVLINSTALENALIANWILHAGAILIPITYLGFVLQLVGIFKEKEVVFRKLLYLGLGIFIFIPFSFFNAAPVSKLIFRYAPDAGPFYWIFTLYFFGVVIYALVLLFKTFSDSRRSKEEKRRFKFVLYSSIVGFMGGGSVFLLTFNVMVLPYPLILFTAYPMIITYAIVRHRLFETKVVTAEVMTLALWLLLLMRALLSDTVQEQVLNGLVFLASLVIGVFLIKSVGEEVRARDEMEALAKRLRAANSRLRELDQQKSEFVSIASHQLRTPLTAIKGYSSMLLDGSFGTLCPNTEDAVEKIYRSSQRLVGVVEDFLNVTRIEQGRMRYDFMPVDMYMVCENVVEELFFAAEDKKIKLIFDCGKPKMLISADEGKIRQVMLNLVDNAIKYTEEGEVRVCLEKEGTEHVVFKVSDTGIGIPKEFKKHMFEKFSRAENSGMHHANGSGIGLYIANEIVKAHRGDIVVDSKEGKGSIFTVTLPQLTEEGMSAAEEKEKSRKTKKKRTFSVKRKKEKNAA
jgi:signal transduction histidine kinase